MLGVSWRRTVVAVRDEASGQALLETTVFLLLVMLMCVFAVNMVSYLQFIQNTSTAAASGTSYSVQGPLSPAAQPLPSNGAVAVVAGNQAAGPLVSSPNVNVCSGATGCSAGFVDPETSTCGWTFSANSVQVQQTFSPVFPASAFGFPILPFGTPQTYTQTVVGRALN